MVLLHSERHLQKKEKTGDFSLALRHYERELSFFLHLSESSLLHVHNNPQHKIHLTKSLYVYYINLLKYLNTQVFVSVVQRL